MMTLKRSPFGSFVDPAALARAFADHVGKAPRLFRAPGRVNVIGDHTDYNGGLALPAAFNKACYVACAKTHDRHLNVMSCNKGEIVALPLDRFARLGHWSDYVGAVAQSLQTAGHSLPGCVMWIDSEVPAGAGVSSSAALEVSVARALLAMVDKTVERCVLAHYASEAETQFVGVPSGPLDQFASVFGKADHALLLDCRSLACKEIRWPSSIALILLDSLVTHSHASGAYADRHAECVEAAARLGLECLRDGAPSATDDARLSPVLRQRVRHVLTENARVLAAVDAIKDDNAAELGRLMRDSHQSLRTDFAVTCAETDWLAALANDTPGVWGARQMGGGFGGCVLAVAERSRAQQCADGVVAAYAKRTGLHLPSLVCTLTDGAEEVAI